MGRKDGRKNLKRVTEFLALDAELVDLAVVTYLAVGFCEKRRDHWLEVTPRIGPKVGPPSPIADIGEQTIDTAAPIRIHEGFKLGEDGRPGCVPLLGEHRDQLVSRPHCVVCQAIGEHVKVACLACGAS